MARRYYYSRFECGHAGCREVANYQSHTRAEQARLHHSLGQGRWRCARHTQPQEVLSKENPRQVREIVTSEHFTDTGASIGLFWGNGSGASGFIYGPGFRAFAKDFPEGTTLRVTAEVVFPAERDASSPAEGRAAAPATDEPQPPSRDNAGGGG